MPLRWSLMQPVSFPAFITSDMTMAWSDIKPAINNWPNLLLLCVWQVCSRRWDHWCRWRGQLACFVVMLLRWSTFSLMQPASFPAFITLDVTMAWSDIKPPTNNWLNPLLLCAWQVCSRRWGQWCRRRGRPACFVVMAHKWFASSLMQPFSLPAMNTLRR